MKKEDQQLLYKAIANGLPHDILLQYSHNGRIGQVSAMYGLGKGYDTDDIKISIDGGSDEHIWMYKPILKPLSDLTKEITHKGETFIPIVELLKIAHESYWNENKDNRYGKIGYKQEGYYIKAWFQNCATRDIEIHTGYIWNEQMWKIEKLREWHFNIDLKEEMYIDINTLKE